MNDDLRDYISKIYSSSQNLLGILNDILDFSKLEAGHVEIENRPFSLPLIMENLQYLYEEQANIKSIKLIIDKAANVPEHIIGDELRIQQILSNLLSNALKFTENGSVSLLISAIGQQGDVVEIEFKVSDTGIGIDKRGLKLLFKPFIQADGSITRRYGGTGLGMAISRDLLKLMGSDFDVTSTPNKGTTFVFTLKLAIDPSGEANNRRRKNKHFEGALTKQLTEGSSKLTGANILVVEDNRINQIVVSKILDLIKADIVITNNGQEALDALNTQDFDIVLMDMNMPVMSGFEATKHIRENKKYKTLPVIALTAGVTKEERQRCMDSGVNDFLAKPIDNQKLIDMLMHWVK